MELWRYLSPGRGCWLTRVIDTEALSLSGSVAFFAAADHLQLMELHSESSESSLKLLKIGNQVQQLEADLQRGLILVRQRGGLACYAVDLKTSVGTDAS